MVIVMATNATVAQVDGTREQLERLGLRTYLARDGFRAVIGCPGDVDAVTSKGVAALPGVEAILPWRAPYRLASRQLAPRGGRTVVRIGDGPDAGVGGPALGGSAGPAPAEEPAMPPAARP